MQKQGVNELRKLFLDFFASKDHLAINSFSLVPKNDNSLLLINSGMAPMKAYFTGQETPPHKRVATCQKCIRTGDIDNVGKTSRHGTFFEMLGNFSFGDYFKSEAIAWAWEFFTEVLSIPEDKLYVSIYEEDDEAAQLWIEQQKLPANRVVRLGKADNFWEHGTGPCGPCSEIYYDRGSDYGCDEECQVGCDCDRYVEIWNLVFTQFEKTEKGEYLPLANPNIDTGMGLERLATMLQGVDSIFDIDTIKVLRDEVCRLSGKSYQVEQQTDVSIRIVTDHVRSMTFMTSDGIMPSNEGRGYVLRRLIRRAARHGKLLGIEGKFLTRLAKTVIDSNAEGYPELHEKEAYIIQVLDVEEERFAETIDQGMALLEEMLNELQEQKKAIMDGKEAFRLYDTYGFPLDLTIEIAEEAGIKIDQVGFNQAMEEQRQRARQARVESNYMGAEETVFHQLKPEIAVTFTGYQQLADESMIVGITLDEAVVTSAKEGQSIVLFVEKTPFYAESGGQVGDYGRLVTETGEMVVEDVKRLIGQNIGHFGRVINGEIQAGQIAQLEVDSDTRLATAKNHSATHLLQRALKNVLGEHVEQAGSSVSKDRLRFDFTHFQAMTVQQIKAVEDEVNQKVLAALPITIRQMSIDEAKQLGAMALFGEKYGDVVRVVNMDGYSIELCGGTHLTNTSQVGLFKIISESGVAAGIRRIEALTSKGAFGYYQAEEKKLLMLADKLRTDQHQLVGRVDQLLVDIKELKQENEVLKSQLAKSKVGELVDQCEVIAGFDCLFARLDVVAMDGLREIGDQLKAQLNKPVIVLAAANQGKVALLAVADDEAINCGVKAGDIIKEIARTVGGGGGGRPQMAQAGGKEISKIGEALEQARQLVNERLINK